MSNETLVPKTISQAVCAIKGSGHKWKHIGQQFERVGRVKGKVRLLLRDKDICTECEKPRLKPIIEKSGE